MTPKCSSGTPELVPTKLDLRPETPKYLNEILDFQFSIVLIVYSALNTLHFTCYKTLHQYVYRIKLFHGQYTVAAIT